jgi:hypothetical protein
VRNAMARVSSVVLLGALIFSGCKSGPDVTVVLSDDRLATVDLTDRAITATPRDLPDREGLQDTLDVLAQAFRTGDRATVAGLLEEPESAFGQRWQNRATWMTGLPLAHYAFDLDETFGDMASDALIADIPGVQIVYVVEETALEGFDPIDKPARDDLFLTVIDTPEGWRFASDEDAEPLGFVSVDHLWDLGPVTTTRQGTIGAIHHPDLGVGQLLDEAQRALATAQARWPLPFPAVVPIVVPRTEEELGKLLHVSFDLSNFVAFATATSFTEQRVYELTGSQIVLNPDRFLRRDTATRELILVHEFIHVATHQVAGNSVPNWLDEGVAQAIGERRSATGTSLLEGLVADGFNGTPPTDTEFRLGGQSRVFLSYQQAWSFVDHLAATYGVERVAAFYAAAGSGAVGLAGSEHWLLDRASREVFGVALADLETDWAASLSLG